MRIKKRGEKMLRNRSLVINGCVFQAFIFKALIYSLWWGSVSVTDYSKDEAFLMQQIAFSIESRAK